MILRLKILLSSLLLVGTLIIANAGAYAAVPLFKDVCQKNGQQSTVCEDANQGPDANPLYGPRGIITIVVNLLSLIVGIAAVIGLIAAGIRFLTSGSEPKEANEARELVIYSMIGLLVAALAQILVRAVLSNTGITEDVVS